MDTGEKQGIIKRAASVATASISSVAKKVSETGVFTIKRMAIIVGLVITAIVAFFVAWYVYNYVKTKATDRVSYVVPETRTPVLGINVTKGDGDGIPDPNNGKRFSFSFWIYIHSLSKNSGLLRHVLHRGEQKNSMGGSPVVYLDPDSNKLHIYFGNSSSTSDEPDDLADKSDIVQVKWRAAKRGVTVDYVPLQRWVHIGVVANENSNGGSIASYVDGELVKTMTTSQIVNVDTYSVTPTLTNLSLDRKGDVYIGGTPTSETGNGFSGLVSVVEFYNYDLNSKDMFDIYSRGPLYLTTADKMANAVGIGSITNQYGIRNPIYKKPNISAD
jgi:hypothetical protein